MRQDIKKIIVLLSILMVTGTVYGEEETLELESVTVTANKQEEKAEKVPISITIFDPISLDDNMMETAADLADFTPGLDVTNYGQALAYSPSMRGVADNSSGTYSVGLYVDGVPFVNGSGFDQTLADIERIEVLRGPQGTLYGKNTEVGAISVITRKPDNEFRAKVSAEIGEDEKRQASFNISGPLVKDKWYLGVSGKHYEKKGFIENPDTGDTIDDRENNYAKVMLRWTPTDALDAFLMASKIKYNNGGNRMNALNAEKDREIATNLDPYCKSEETLTALHLTYSFSQEFSLNSVTTRRLFNNKKADDWDFSNQTTSHQFKDSDDDTISQELRLNYTTEGLKTLIGAYWDKRYIDNNAKVIKTASTTYKNSENYSRSFGLFAHVTYAVSDRLNTSIGLRNDEEQKEFKNKKKNIDIDGSWTEMSPKLAVQYQLNENAMIFANAAKGYRAGGFNSNAPDGYSMNYDEEVLWSYEIGTKSSFLGNRISLESSLYYMNIDDMQVDVYIDNTIWRTNAAKATSSGIEAQLKAKLTTEMQLNTGVSYNRCVYDEYEDSKGDYAGNYNPFAPEYDFNIQLQYRGASGLYASTGLVGYGKTYFDRKNEYSRDPYQLVNAKIGYEMSQLDVYLYGKNIFNEVYDSEGVWSYYTIYSPPREIGVSMAYRF